MSVLSLKVNGKTHSLDVDPTTPLLYVLSDDLGLRGPKFGCGLGQCGSPEKPHPIQKAFIEEQAAQCGYCLNGVILTAKAFLDKNPKATEAEIQQGMSRVLCRCFTHTRMLRAIGRAQKEMAR
jgi:nicotinate dehydrogenase subunit A